MDTCCTEILNHLLPDCSRVIEALGFNFDLRGYCKKRRRPKVLASGPREPSNKLERDTERAVRRVNGCNLETRKIEALAEHVDANDPIKLARGKLSDNGFDVFQRFFTCNDFQPQPRVLPIQPEELGRPLATVGAHHQPVLIASLAIDCILTFGREGYRHVVILAGSRYH